MRGMAISRRRPGRRQRELSGYLLISPALLFLIVFVLIPALWIFWLSFQRWDLISGASDYIGTANYERLLLRDDVFRKSVWQTVYFVVGTVPTSMALGLFLAVVLNRAMPLRDLLRTLIFTPYVMPIVSTALIFSFIYHPDVGVLNAVLNAFGLPKINWLNSPRAVMPAIIIYSVWQHTGYNTVIYLAGLANLGPELDEAAARCSKQHPLAERSPSNGTDQSAPRSGKMRRVAATADICAKSSRKLGSPARRVRSASVLTKNPISPSISARLRLAIGEPTTMSSCPL